MLGIKKNISLRFIITSLLLITLGLIWSECKQLWDEGLKAYIQDMWNILDFITNSLYIATYTLKLVAYLKVITYSCAHKGDWILKKMIDNYNPH